MALIKDLIPQSQYDTKCPYSMTPIGICIHNTANNASARNEVAYLKSNNNEVSYHIAIDDVEAIQCIPFDRNAWHAGDGAYGEGNRNYIAVEICYSANGGERFIQAEKRAAKEVAALLKQFGWDINRVRKHQDFSGKNCPHRTLLMGWQRFLNMIQAELNGSEGGFTMKKVVLYQGDIDALSALLVAQKHRCALMSVDDYTASGEKAAQILQVGGKAGDTDRFATFKNAGKLLQEVAYGQLI